MSCYAGPIISEIFFQAKPFLLHTLKGEKHIHLQHIFSIPEIVLRNKYNLQQLVVKQISNVKQETLDTKHTILCYNHYCLLLNYDGGLVHCDNVYDVVEAATIINLKQQTIVQLDVGRMVNYNLPHLQAACQQILITKTNFID